MATISVLDAVGATQTIQAPNANGRAAASASRPIALSTEDKASLDAISTAIAALDGGDATAANQVAQTALLTSIDDTLAGSLAVTGNFYPATQPVSGSVSVSGPVAVTGSFFPTTQPVSIADPVAVTGTFYPATQPVSGTVSISGSVAVTGTFFQATQPVSIAAPVAVTGTFWQATQPISAASLPLPSGAATEATLAAQSAKLPASLGAKASAASLSVVLASDQASLPVTAAVASSCNRLLSAAATTNATSVKTSAGTVKAIQGFNAKATPVYLKLYNKATAPTVGTDTPVKTIYLPASSAFALDFSFSFSTGIAYALTGAAADADTTNLVAGDILCLNLDYI